MKVIVHRPDFTSPPKRIIGLGDAVKLALAPIVKVVDTATGSNLTKCGGCQKRAEKLNALVPDITHPFK